MSTGGSQSCNFPSTTDSEGGVSPLWELEQVKPVANKHFVFKYLYWWVIRSYVCCIPFCYCIPFPFLEGD